MRQKPLNRNTYNLVDAEELTDFSAAIDLVERGITGSAARQFIVLEPGGGVLEVRTAKGLRQYSAALLVGIPVSLGIFEITSNTSVGTLLVGW